MKTQVKVDMRGNVDDNGFYVDVEEAYKVLNFQESILDSTMKFKSTFDSLKQLLDKTNYPTLIQKYGEINKLFVLYVEYMDPFFNKFQSFLSNMSSLGNQNFFGALDLMNLSEGNINLEKLDVDDMSKEEIEKITFEYSVILDWCERTGNDYYKKYYTFDDLKNGDKDAYYKWLEYDSIQRWASKKGFKYGEFPYNSYKEFKEGNSAGIYVSGSVANEQFYLDNVHKLDGKNEIALDDDNIDSSVVSEYDYMFKNLNGKNEISVYDDDETVEINNVTYDDFLSENNSFELFVSDNNISSSKHNLNELTFDEAKKYIEWSLFHYPDIKEILEGMGYSSLGNMGQLNLQLGRLQDERDRNWENLLKLKIPDVGTACIEFYESGMYSAKYLDEDASDYVLGYYFTHPDPDGRRDYIKNDNALQVLSAMGIDLNTCKPLYLSEYANDPLYQKMIQELQSDSNFESWQDYSFVKEAFAAKEKREQEIIVATGIYDKSYSKWSDLDYVKQTIENMASSNCLTISATWQPDYENLSKPKNVAPGAKEYFDDVVENYCKEYGDYSGDSPMITVNLDTSEMLKFLSLLINGTDMFVISAESLFYDYSDSLGIHMFSDDAIWKNYLLWFSVMYDSEKAAFNYYYSQSEEEAIHYLESMSDLLDARYVESCQKRDTAYAKENPVKASLDSVFVTPINGISSFFYSIDSLISDEEIRMSHTYNSGDVYRGTVGNMIASNENLGVFAEPLSFLYSTGMSMVDSTLLLAADLATGGSLRFLLSATLMGSRSYVSTLNDALSRGLSDGEAVALAFSAAVTESLMEKWSVGSLLNLDNTLNSTLNNALEKISNKKGLHSIVKVLGGAAIQGISEGQEELCTEIVNNLMDSLISGDLSSYRLAVEEKINAGYSPEDAIAEANKEFAKELRNAFLGGLVSGGLRGGFFTTIDTVISENNISKISSYISNIQSLSTENFNIKNFQVNLRNGDYVTAMESISNLQNVDFATKVLATGTFYDALNSSKLDVGSADHIQLKYIKDAALKEFMKLNSQEQFEQFNNLSLENQRAFVNYLGVHRDAFISKLDPIVLQNLFNESNNKNQSSNSKVEDVNPSNDILESKIPDNSLCKEFKAGKDIFGGDQSSIIDRFNKIFKNANDKIYLQELETTVRKYYPDITEEQLKSLYQKISDSGCTYVAVANVIFEQLNYNEALFKEKFGFGMYRSDGTLNHEQLVVDIFCSLDTLVCVQYKTKKVQTYDSWISAARDLLGVEYANVGDAVSQLYAVYSNNCTFDSHPDGSVTINQYDSSNGKECIIGSVDSIAEQLLGKDFVVNNKVELKDLLNKYGYSANIEEINSSSKLFNTMSTTGGLDGWINAYLQNKSIDMRFDSKIICCDSDIMNKLEILYSEGYSIFVSSENFGEVHMTDGTKAGWIQLGSEAGVGHRMTLRGITASGDVIVSSWGKFYKIPKEFANSLTYVATKMSDAKLIDNNIMGDSNYSSGETNIANSTVNTVFAQLMNLITLGEFSKISQYLKVMSNEQVIDVLSTIVNEMNNNFSSEVNSLYINVLSSLTINQFANAVENGLVRFSNGYYNDLSLSVGYNKVISMKTILNILSDDSLCARFINSFNMNVPCFSDYTNEEIIRGIKALDYELAGLDISFNNGSYYQMELYNLALNFNDYNSNTSQNINSVSNVFDLWFENGTIATQIIVGTKDINVSTTQVMEIINSVKYTELLVDKNLSSSYAFMSAINDIRVRLDAYGNVLGLSEQQISNIYRISDTYRSDLFNMNTETQRAAAELETRGFDVLVIDGVSYNVIKDIDISKQKITVQMIASIIDTMPQILKDKIKCVNLYDCANPYDPYWAIVYDTPGFVSAATGGGNLINIYAGSSNSSLYQLQLTIYHESGHLLDDSLGKISNTDTWLYAIRSDNNYPTEYSKCSPAEDFADSVKQYFSEYDKFHKEHPNRAKVLDGIFNLDTAKMQEIVIGEYVESIAPTMLNPTSAGITEVVNGRIKYIQKLIDSKKIVEGLTAFDVLDKINEGEDIENILLDDSILDEFSDVMGIASDDDSLVSAEDFDIDI